MGDGRRSGTAALQQPDKRRAMCGDLTVFDVLDPREMSTSAQGVSFARRLQDRDLMRVRFDKPISRFTGRIFGGIATSTSEDRFATEVDVGGDGTYFAFYALRHGWASLSQHGHETTGAGSDGLVFRFTPGTRLLTSDLSARAILYVEAAALEDALEGLLDTRLRERLAFKPGIDWSGGLAASLKGQIDFLIGEMGRQGGVADNPVALAFLTDLVVSLVLRGVPHNYLDRLGSGRSGVVPAYVRRADEFMRAHTAIPIRMEQVAAAAGCSVRTLNAVFRQFRDTTPLAALHAIRLEQVHTELSRRMTDASVAELARCYGFTNPGRFTTAYRRRFGESPIETVRGGPR
jgi:AraC-like DNA-binding protein